MTGCCAVVVGGLVAAISGPAGLTDGSWLAAYLVLVCGIAQVVIGAMQQALVDRPVPRQRRLLLTATWNVGNALVLAGTLLNLPWLVHIGSASLLMTLVAVLAKIRHVRRYRVFAWGCRAFLVIVALSVPAGSILTQVRAG